MTKSLYLIIFAVLSFSIPTFADYASSRCEITKGNEDGFERLPSILGGSKFEKLQINCCKNSIKVACETKATFDGCRGTLNAIKDECSDDCELFVKDCDEYITNDEVRKAFFSAD